MSENYCFPVSFKHLFLQPIKFINMFLWDSIAFGPISSRRLGKSLGINILPTTKKICSFNCIYCECGWTLERDFNDDDFYPVDTVMEAIENKLINCRKDQIAIDSITFSGNGEPTMHPHFGQIIDGLIALRDRYYPGTIITCLSNSTQLYRTEVREALLKIENPLLKLDAGSDQLYRLINRPTLPVTFEEIVSYLRGFNGQLIIQTLLFKGEIDDIYFDNSSGEELDLLIHHIVEIAPRSVMLYSLDRETPARHLTKISKEDLEKVAEKIEKKGIKTSVY